MTNNQKSEIRYTAAGGVVIHQAKVLLLDRPARGEIRLPKGHLEEGETPEITALRETVEETGYAELAIVADLGSQVVEFDYDGSHCVRTEHYFLMRLVSDRQVARNAHDSAEFNVLWSPLAQAVDRLSFASEKAVAHKAIAHYHHDLGSSSSVGA